MTGKIVQFPLDRVIRKQQIVDEAIETLADEITIETMTMLYDEGYNIEADDHICSISFFFEAARSLVSELNLKHHPLQKIANDMYAEYMYEVNSDVPEQLEFDF